MMNSFSQTFLASLFTTITLVQTPTAVKPVDYFAVPVQQQIRPTEWVVKPNDTLGDIAEKLYGSREHWTILWNDNPWIEDPHVIEKDWKLVVRKENPTSKEELLPELAEKIAPPPVVYAYTPSHLENEGLGVVTLPSSPTPAAPPSNYEDIYKEAGAKYGVPWQVLYGLHLTETGLRDGTIYNGQGSGARGPMQFMPGTWAAYGADGDGDGVANIDNARDAIHGAANFLQKHGSLENGLRSYGGNTAGTITAAQSKGFGQ